MPGLSRRRYKRSRFGSRKAGRRTNRRRTKLSRRTRRIHPRKRSGTRRRIRRSSRRSSSLSTISQVGGRRFGPRPRRVRSVSSKFAAAVNRAINPIRIFNTDGNSPPAVVRGTNSSQNLYRLYELCSVTDLQGLMTSYVQTVVQTSGIVAQPNVGDYKLMLEAAFLRTKCTNMCTSAITMTCYTVTPRRDLYGTSSNAINPLTLLQVGTTWMSGDTTKLPSTDINFDVYTSEMTRYYKIVSQKTVVIMPGCVAEFSARVGKRIVRHRRIYPTGDINSAYYLKGFSTSLLFKFHSQAMGVEQTGHTPALPAVAVGFESKEEYHFRGLVDPRPMYYESPSELAVLPVAGTAVDILESITDSILPVAFVT